MMTFIAAKINIFARFCALQLLVIQLFKCLLC